MRQVLYKLVKGNFTRSERSFIRSTLMDARGWGKDYDFVLRRGTEPADVIFEIWDSQKIAKTYGKKFRKFSVCSTDGGTATGGTATRASKIVINQDNWDNGSKTYRQYVLQHEMGHALGNGHRKMAPLGACNVMTVQSNRRLTCTLNPWQ